MSRHPWMKWYPADWRSEKLLRMVSRAARSFWMDLIGLMHEAEPYGHLIVFNISPNLRQIASILGDRESDVGKWLAELEAANVFSRTEEGIIYCRRMVRDNEKQTRDRINGKGGGNPLLTGRLNQGVNPPVKAYILDARSQKPEEESRDPSLLSKICSELGIRLEDDTRRITWPGDLAAALATGADPQGLLEAARIAKTRGKVSLKYVLATAQGLKAERANGHSHTNGTGPPPTYRPARSDDEWRSRLATWREICAKNPNLTPADCWSDPWGPAPNTPGCKVPHHLLTP